ncbi:hypothetical protein Lepto7375DRAFT_0547 [Leptolyngbya sp. PCC 7375]|nr:hypothetical protein Lepto7375DRAFT_0547 [Leptolyngbya sp. PCC 7375]
MAEIRVHKRVDDYGNVLQSYEWVGPASEPVEIDYRVCQLLDDLPWRLIELKQRSLWRFGVRVFVREDTGCWIAYHWLVNHWMIHHNAFLVFQQRLILTFHLWGIGYTPPHEIPQWKNLACKHRYW